ISWDFGKMSIRTQDHSRLCRFGLSVPRYWSTPGAVVFRRSAMWEKFRQKYSLQTYPHGRCVASGLHTRRQASLKLRCPCALARRISCSFNKPLISLTTVAGLTSQVPIRFTALAQEARNRQLLPLPSSRSGRKSPISPAEFLTQVTFLRVRGPSIRDL